MIKLFEEYNEYYQEINNDEFLDLSYAGNYYFDRIVSFTPSEIQYINNIPQIHLDKGGISLTYYYRHSLLYLYKLPDEWFMVKCILSNNTNYYYKCDQLEGLKKCIENL